MNRVIFESYVETQLAPILKQGHLVILGNLAAHKSQRAENIIRAKGAWFLFLPPYSPDFNPIEMTFSKFKSWLQKTAAKTVEYLWKAIGNIYSLLTPDECSNYYTEAGYGFN
jgi:transposase